MGGELTGSDLRGLARLAARVSRALENFREATEELVLGELRRAVAGELARALYQVRLPEQPKPEELKSEVVRLLGLEGVRDLAEELEEVLRGGKSSRAERVREGAAGAAGVS